MPTNRTDQQPNMERFVSPHIRAMQPYAPISPPDVLEGETGSGATRIIKLDGNENPYAPSPRVKKVIAEEIANVNFYPDPEQRALRKALATYTAYDADWLVAGSGSDELIDLLLRLFVDKGEEVIYTPPTFGMYSFNTKLVGGVGVEVRRKDDWSLDVDAVAKAVTGRTKVILLASPNNPTGDLVSRAELLRLLDTGAPVVIDEAYYEFAGETVIDMVRERSNLIVLRTFSKWAGLAGLRVGYGVMHPSVAARLMLIKPPYNVNNLAQKAAAASVEDRGYLMDSVHRMVRDRDALMRDLAETGMLHPYPSRANFILCKVLRGDARHIHQKLRTQGIFIRYFDSPRLQDHIRISIGTAEDHKALLTALKGLA